jgi:phosphopentomutase
MFKHISEYKRAKMRTILLVIDGLGVGNLPYPADLERPTNTLASISETAGNSFPTLRRLNLFNLMCPVAQFFGTFGIASGRIAPSYQGADSYLGHLELIGGSVTPHRLALSDFAVYLCRHLSKDHIVEIESSGIMLVDGSVAVYDNLECAPGLCLSVLGSLDQTSYDHMLRVGQRVREVACLSRVIVMGGKPLNMEKALRSEVRRKDSELGQLIGLDTPALGVFNESYRVTHLPVNTQSRTLLSNFATMRLDVSLIGKAADLFVSQNTTIFSSSKTSGVADCVLQQIRCQSNGLIFANMQTVDLAGHAQDSFAASHALAEIDDAVLSIIQNMNQDDILVITADHGNDPLSGHSHHTREYVPLIMTGGALAPWTIGTRYSLADIGQTISSWHQVPLLSIGTPILIKTTDEAAG